MKSRVVSVPVSGRFWLLLGLALVAGSAGWSALVLYSDTWAEARDLDRIFPFYVWRTPAFSASAYAALRRGLALGSAAAGGILLSLSALRAGRREWSALMQELRVSGNELLKPWKKLSLRHRRLALGALGGLGALRLFFSFNNPGYDDAVSYELFVSKGLLATSAYYPIPNNHVFSNTISWLFYQLNQGFWWSMRVPVLLVSMAGTAYLFLALLRHSNFRVAALATGLFSCLQLNLYHAGVGRAYWLMITLAGIVFFSTLHLSRDGSRARTAWLALVLSCVLGGYTVPPFAYVVASAFGWLGVRTLQRREWGRLPLLLAVGSFIVLVDIVLYAPLMLISGADQLVGNGYVQALPLAQFWRGLPAYVWYNEGFLAGQRTVGAVLTLAGLGVLAGLHRLRRRDRLPAETAGLLVRLGGPALWFMLLPYGLILVQRVYPPERTLLYKGFFFFLLAGIALDWGLRRWPAPRYRWPRNVLAGCIVLFVSYEAWYVVRVNPAARATNGSYRAGVYWLAGQPPGPVLNPEPTLNIFFRFYAHSELPRRPWHFAATPQPGQQFTYVVAFTNRRGFFQPEFSFAPAYRNGELEIYRVPRHFQVDMRAWLH